VYPGFILYRASRQAFALIDAAELTLAFSVQRFVEDSPVLSDAKVAEQAWYKSNKDGSPDRRFRDNYQMPVVLYGVLTFTSPSGLREEYQCSNHALAERFAKTWNTSAPKGGAAKIPTASDGRRPAPRDIDGPFKSWTSANDAFFNRILAFEVGPNGESHGTLSRSDLSAYVQTVSEFVDAAKGFADDIAGCAGWAESMGVPRRKLSRLRTLEPSFRPALAQFETAYQRFGSLSAAGGPIVTEDLTEYMGAVAAFVRALKALREGWAAAVEKLSESI
jgi:hypothetical protein